MAEHRYWRATGFFAYDAGKTIELTEFQLLSGTTRVDAGAVLTCSETPSFGALANLSDGSATGVVTLTASAVLTWDFGAAQEVSDIRIGSGASVDHFPLGLVMQWSDDGAIWSALYKTTLSEYPFYGITWPGARTFTRSSAQNVTTDSVFNKDWSDGSISGQTLYSVSGESMQTVENGALHLSAPRGRDVKVRFSGMPSLADFDVTARLWVSATTAVNLVYRTTTWVNENDTYAYLPAVYPRGVSIAHGSNSPYGSFTPLTSAPASTEVGQLVDFRMRVVGDEHRYYVDGALVMVVQDSVFRNSGEIGLRIFSGDAYYKNLTVSPVQRISIIESGPQRGITLSADAFSRSVGAAPSFHDVASFSAVLARPNFMFDRGARGRINGTVARKGSPANILLKRRVRLFRDIDGMLIAETWSDPITGAYSFDYVEENWTYTVIAYDYEHNYRAVLGDNLTPVLIQ